jgi:hypothetical protein
VLLPDHPYLPLTPTTWREVLSSIELFSAVGISIVVDFVALQVSVSSKSRKFVKHPRLKYPKDRVVIIRPESYWSESASLDQAC